MPGARWMVVQSALGAIVSTVTIVTAVASLITVNTVTTGTTVTDVATVATVPNIITKSLDWITVSDFTVFWHFDPGHSSRFCCNETAERAWGNVFHVSNRSEAYFSPIRINYFARTRMWQTWQSNFVFYFIQQNFWSKTVFKASGWIVYKMYTLLKFDNPT